MIGRLPFSWRTRVYWEDTDAGGVVYHAAYLRFMERARTEWLRAAGVAQAELLADQGIAFVLRDMQIDFRAPARLDDELDVNVVPDSMRAASFRVRQEIACGDRQLVTASVRIACIDHAAMRPQPIPANILSRIRSL